MAIMEQHGEYGSAWRKWNSMGIGEYGTSWRLWNSMANMEQHGDYGTVWRIWNSMAIAASVAVKLNFKAGGIKLFDHGYTILEKI